jgi:hypothetical protein
VPADGWLDALGATVSRGLSELCCRANLSAKSFAKAAALLARAAQVSVGTETLRQVILAEGQAVLAQQSSPILLPLWQASACQTPTPTGGSVSRVYASCDGVKVPVRTDPEVRKRRQKAVARRRKLRRAGKKLRPLPAAVRGADQGWKEVKVVACYDQDMAHKHVRATRGNHQQAGKLLAQATAQLGFAQADEAVGVVDGADWIRGQFHARKIPVDALGLDFYHLSEHVHGACREVLGEGSPAAAAQAGDLLHTVRHTGCSAFVEAMETWRRRTRGTRRKGAIAKLLGYVEPRAEMIAYPRFEAHGWHIGSGPIEAACKTVPARLKGAGMRWSIHNLEPLLALECLDESDQWQLHWPDYMPPPGSPTLARNYG